MLVFRKRIMIHWNPLHCIALHCAAFFLIWLKEIITEFIHYSPEVILYRKGILFGIQLPFLAIPISLRKVSENIFTLIYSSYFPFWVFCVSRLDQDYFWTKKEIWLKQKGWQGEKRGMNLRSLSVFWNNTARICPCKKYGRTTIMVIMSTVE